MNEHAASSAERANAYATLASLLLNPPDDAELKQAYLERLLVPCSPAYVPLSEQCVRGAVEDDGRWTFGPVDGVHSRHVLRCYERAGFDYRRLCGHEPLVRSLRPDSLAAECAFVAFLLEHAEHASDEEASAGRIAYAEAFLREHMGKWVCDAAHACAQACPDDLVTYIVKTCAERVCADVADIPCAGKR